MIFFGDNFEEELKAYEAEQLVLSTLHKDITESVRELSVYQAAQRKLEQDKEEFEKVMEEVFKKNREKERIAAEQEKKPVGTPHNYKLRIRKQLSYSELKPKRQKTKDNAPPNLTQNDPTQKNHM